MPCLQCCCKGVCGRPCSVSAQQGLEAFSAQLTSVEVGGVFSMHIAALRQRPVGTPGLQLMSEVYPANMAKQVGDL